jgi:uncharacterized membrane protein
MERPRSVWAQSSVRSKVVSGVVAVVGFVLLLLVVNTYGNLGGDRPGDLLVSIIFALVISGVFAIGLLCLSVGSTSMRQEHVAWYNQPVFLQGIGFILAALTFLMIVGSLSHLLPHLLAAALSILCAMLGLACALWSVGVSQAHRKS